MTNCQLFFCRPIGGGAIILVLICTCYRAAQEVDDNNDDLESIRVDPVTDDYVNYDIEDTYIIDVQNNSITNFQNFAKRPSETSKNFVFCAKLPSLIFNKNFYFLIKMVLFLLSFTVEKISYSYKYSLIQNILGV